MAEPSARSCEAPVVSSITLDSCNNVYLYIHRFLRGKFIYSVWRIPGGSPAYSENKTRSIKPDHISSNFNVLIYILVKTSPVVFTCLVNTAQIPEDASYL